MRGVPVGAGGPPVTAAVRLTHDGDPERVRGRDRGGSGRRSWRCWRSSPSRHLELRSAWSVNVADFDDRQVARIRRALDGAGVAVSAIGSPIGKIAVDAPLAPELDRLRRVADIAAALGTGWCGCSRSSCPRGAVRRVPRAGPGPDGRARRDRRGARPGPGPREREGDLRGHPGSGARRSSARSGPRRCGPRSTRPTSCSAGWPRTPRPIPCSPRIWSTCRSRTPWPPPGRWCPPGG